MADYRQWIDSLSEPSGVLEAIQKKGRESLLAIGLPKKNHENWRLTDLKRLKALINLPLSSEKNCLVKHDQTKQFHKNENCIKINMDMFPHIGNCTVKGLNTCKYPWYSRDVQRCTSLRNL